MIIAITGHPGTGKTTLAEQIASDTDATVVHADDFVHLPWAEIPGAILAVVNAVHGNVIVEGCQVARLLGRDFTPDLLIALDQRWRPSRPVDAGLEAVVTKYLAEYTGPLLSGSPRRLRKKP